MLLAGCSAVAPQPPLGATAHNGVAVAGATAPETVGSLTYRAVETLAGDARGAVAPGDPVLVTTFVDIDDLGRSSTLGRVVAEQAASRLVQLGYAVREVRMTRALAIRPGTGELILSREARAVIDRIDAKAIVVGTYGAGQRYIYVNMRMVAAESGQVLSAIDLALPYNADTRMLLARR